MALNISFHVAIKYLAKPNFVSAEGSMTYDQFSNDFKIEVTFHIRLRIEHSKRGQEIGALGTCLQNFFLSIIAL